MPADGRPCLEVTGQFEGTPTGQTCSRWAPQRVMLATDRNAQKQSDSENKGLKTQELSASRNSRSGKATPHSRV